jgi:hypothetical protein
VLSHTVTAPASALRLPKNPGKSKGFDDVDDQ